MAEQNTEAKLKKLLKQEMIQLWNPPYTDGDGPGEQHVQVGSEISALLLSQQDVKLLSLFHQPGSGSALGPPAVPVPERGGRSSGVHQGPGGEEREEEPDVQGDQRGDAGAAAAQRRQEGTTPGPVQVQV